MYGEMVSCGRPPGGTDYALALADWARVELLKEKVKRRMDEKYGKRLDRLADLIAEVVSERMKGAREMEGREEELRKAIEEFGEAA